MKLLVLKWLTNDFCKLSPTKLLSDDVYVLVILNSSEAIFSISIFPLKILVDSYQLLFKSFLSISYSIVTLSLFFSAIEIIGSELNQKLTPSVGIKSLISKLEIAS